MKGLYAVEFARQGAQAVAVEGREVNLEKVRFVKKALGLAASRKLHTHGGKPYWGREVFEPAPGAPLEERLKYRWRSLDNPKSFWIMRRSLYNLLLASGFTTVYECHVPAEIEKDPGPWRAEARPPRKGASV